MTTTSDQLPLTLRTEPTPQPAIADDGQPIGWTSSDGRTGPKYVGDGAGQAQSNDPTRFDYLGKPPVPRINPWREYGYLTLHFLLCGFALAYFLLVPITAAGLLVTVVGLFAAGGLVLGARGWAAMYRGLDRTFLDSYIAPPPAFVRPRGFWRSLGAMLFDGTGWRALLYMFVSFPLAYIGWVLSTIWLAIGIGGITYPIWWRFLPLQTMADGTVHRGFSVTNFDHYWFAETPGRVALVALGGLLFAAMWVPLTHAFAMAFRKLGEGLLGVTPGSIRVAQLRAQRAAAVTDADARLRQIERDLHDGTQAQLTAIAMQIGEAREVLASGEDPALAAQLLATAQQSTKDAMSGLRDIASGVRPPTLDAGLTVALQSLVARSSLPVTLELPEGIDQGVDPAIGAIAYYTAAELLNNAAKHSGATQVWVSAVRSTPETLLLRVTDDGAGGARVVSTTERAVVGRETGLAGLVDRLATVDGTLSITSPIGGPTEIDVTVPTSAR